MVKWYLSGKHDCIYHPSIHPGVTRDGNKEEFVNESETLSSINLFTPLLKLVEKIGDMEEKVSYILRHIISMLIRNIIANSVSATEC